MYDLGRGVPQDYAEAMKWFRKAADQNHAKAQYNIGFMYEHGQGVPQNHHGAMTWYRKAADQGDRCSADQRRQHVRAGRKACRIDYA